MPEGRAVRAALPGRPGAALDPHAPDARLIAEVRRRAAGGTAPARETVAAIVRDRGAVLGSADLDALVAAVGAEVGGAGPLQPLLDAPDVTDVLVNGPRDVWVDRGRGLERTGLDLGDASRVRALAVRLAAAGGQRLDDAAPVVDARLPDGTRLHAVLPPVAPDGALLSLRVLRRTSFSLEELVASGTVAAEVAPVLRALVASRANVLVSGATGTGKTTLLASLLGLVPHDERVVVIEEVGELAPRHPHVVRLAARRPNVEGAGEVDLAALVRHALRMRPDRIVLGECRGAEVREVLTALNTGHDGGWATVHANGVRDVPARLEALGALAGLGPEALAAQAAGALDAVVHLRRTDGRRRVAEIGAIALGRRLVVEPVLESGPDGAVRYGPGWPALAARCGLATCAGGAR
ncbi:TadA family conjugal transfer-associated ATPase [Actinotalea sp. JY-7876]|uniref:TadA family conjugal transfer-associated ATPase n=1 Tax=Actinotalea sp. JY-7876 TaxID=2758442 RepID=UPI0021076842|nr:TadA family conjugal transfer-associated ATPase [Actinotalea sp. JY-7876]